MLTALGGLAVVPALGACSRDDENGYTVARWRKDRGDRFFVAHRGSGDVFPEHSLEAYEGALAWGARALEISVVQTSDGALICQHDLTFDRTTNLKGKAATQPSSVLLDGRIVVPRLGPRWQGDRAPRIPRLDEVLRRIGRRCVMFIEPKDDSAFPGIIRMVKERDLQSSVMMKLHYRTQRIPEAHAAGMGVFCYIGDPSELTADRVADVAGRLDPTKDVLVVPAYGDDGVISEAQLAIARSGNVPLWVFPVHRRWEAAYFHARGVEGIITSSYGYVSQSVQPVRAAEWDAGALAGGEMTRFPEVDSYGLGWPEPGVIQLASQGRQAFLTLGQLAPLERTPGPYTISFEIRVDEPPKDDKSNFTLCFAHSDDSYYEHQQGTQNGYHAIVRMNGTLELRVHETGSQNGEEIAKASSGPPLVPGAWIPLKLEVDTERITWGRGDVGLSTSGVHTKYRGDYIHIGRSADQGKISVRALKVT